jgi:hypothetical protein
MQIISAWGEFVGGGKLVKYPNLSPPPQPLQNLFFFSLTTVVLFNSFKWLGWDLGMGSLEFLKSVLDPFENPFFDI